MRLLGFGLRWSTALALGLASCADFKSSSDAVAAAPDAATPDGAPAADSANDGLPADGPPSADGPSPACDPTKPFGAPQPIHELNTASAQTTLRLAADYTTGYFSSARGSPTNWICSPTCARTRAGPSAPPRACRSLTPQPRSTTRQ
jgi:hypothetical protein